MIPKVLVAYLHRPMSLGLFVKDAFRQAGCAVLSCGPAIPHVYGRPGGGEHVFPDEDYVGPAVELRNAAVELREAVDLAAREGFDPDLVVMVDQMDDFFLAGASPPGVGFAYWCVENWGEFYRRRIEAGRPDRCYYQIAHSQTVPFPRDDMTWLPFGFDPFIHPYIDGERTKKAVQIGTAYEPRPAVWNHLRQRFDGAPPVSPGEYLESLHESESTLFGRAPGYRAMAAACNRAKVALSSSNCDFSPMRTCEAYAMGSVLASDDVPAVRAVLGPPLSEGGFWVAHDRTPEGHARAVEEACEAYDEIVDRGVAHVYKRHQYKHRAELVLAQFGLQGACRMVA